VLTFIMVHFCSDSYVYRRSAIFKARDFNCSAHPTINRSQRMFNVEDMIFFRETFVELCSIADRNQLVKKLQLDGYVSKLFSCAIETLSPITVSVEYYTAMSLSDVF